MLNLSLTRDIYSVLVGRCRAGKYTAGHKQDEHGLFGSWLLIFVFSTTLRQKTGKHGEIRDGYSYRG